MKQKSDWLLNLSEDDISFIKQFVLSSGSLKEIAAYYEVTYPTVRSRLNKIIQKIKSFDEPQDDEFLNLIKRLAINDQIDFEAATLLIETYRRGKK